MRAIFQNRDVLLTKKKQQTFVQYVTVWLAWIWRYKNAGKKEHTFLWRRKNGQTRTKNGYCLNQPLQTGPHIGSVAESVKASFLRRS